ncbi:MAG TPA: CpsB/CapC family capsule biosynthesis tyrosine phosphatase [Acidobacteriota bacterium]|nr:CpsB/CapC family capsule biosynthesis tyrosine phosphatase [Acidobacteriota bacterium]
MIDLHTHFLWDWDDGPDDRAQALTMCRIAEKDGTTAIGLTPHVFRMTRHADDLGILRQRMVAFESQMRESGVGLELHWGAEVFVHADIVRAIELYRFTIDQTSYVFLEFASEGVPVGAAAMLAQLMSKGFVPIISHPERNRGFASRPELLYEFVAMGCAAQVTAASLTGELGKEVRTTAGLFLVNNLVHIIASDAHRALGRPPGLSRAVESAAKIVGESKARAMVTEIPRAILENKALPDWGEPQNPLGRTSWTRRLIGLPRRSPRMAEAVSEPGGKKGQRPERSRTTLLKIN